MSRPAYETAWTLVYDPVSGNRAATRSALYSLGFRQIELVPTLAAFADSISNRPPDLALCEAHGSEEQLCSLIQDLRQGMTGYSPFVVIIVTAWEKSSTLAARVVNSGADDLLLRPFWPALLDQRIRVHVERRKGFIITSEYVGPDRRKSTSRQENIDVFYPPNSLKMKALDGLSEEQANDRLAGELKVACQTLTAEKLRRDAFQVCILWRLMQQAPGASRYAVDLSKLADLVRGIAARCRDTAAHEAAEWCHALLAATEALQMGIDRASAVKMLGKAAVRLLLIVEPEKAQAEQVARIEATAALIQSRSKVALAG
jgi:DNA-binding response OmpR family regulator